MPDCLTYFFLFPVAVIIAILAMSAGISGTNFWIPVYIIWLGIDTKTAFWLGLLTMIFGFGSGTLRNLKQKTINWPIVKEYLKITIPAAVFGALLVPFAPEGILLLLFASFILIYGSYLVYRYWLYRRGKFQEKLATRDHICWKRAAVAGFLKGLIATGLGKLITPCIMEHKEIKSPAEAVGSTVPIIFIVNFIALLFRLTPDFISVLADQKEMIFDVMLWVAPGVILGGQIGPAVARKLSVQGMKLYTGSLLIGVSLLIYIRAFTLF
ncbi:sulfite exporter TauE/SafE family protein [Methanosarcina sp. KYL-1]|uniref:sulfite exporter TauE/SafE family protein n=1 Tax=Methanosarcina sp. KYL-1 TaxID=2602068 RepID=UPI002100B8E4|nr:sulfite exporter TauE/SafE family protein [Methanosarcina sp. KYL-1]MCQ1536330.1 sulfite exporter TauE/SafE family protein [Methanosarcina sp. KYL-1]